MAEISVAAPRWNVPRFIWQATLVFVAYYLAGKLGQATAEIRSSNIGPVWPAYGVALAAFVLCGYRIWPVLLAAACLVASQSGVPILTATGQATGSVLAAATGWFLLQRAGFDPSLSRLRDVLSVIVLGAFVSAVVSSSLGVGVLYATGLQAYSGILRAWLIYWMGDATGVLLITPLILAGTGLLKLTDLSRIAEFASLVILVILACFAFFAIKPHAPTLLLFPFVIWGAIRFGVGGSSVVTLIIATAATVATALGIGPFARYSVFANAMLLDVFFGVLCVSGLMLASLIAEREKAEAERKQSIRKQAGMEARLRLAAIVESSEDAIVGKDINGIITDWNAGAEKLYGYDKSEAIGAVFSSLVRSHMGRGGLDFTKKSDVVNRHETIHYNKSGSPIEVSVTMSPIRDATGHIAGISLIAHDITERQRAVNALQESQDKLRLILDSAAEGIFGLDLEGRCTFCNQAGLRLLGYASENALLGRVMHDVIHHTHPDGTPFPAEECHQLDQVLQAEKGIHIEGEVLWRADGSSFHADGWVQPQRRGGRVVGAVVAFSDITQRRRSEEEAATLRDELAHLSRVGMLGALSGTLAHEINQPLAAIQINAEAALNMLGTQSPPMQEVRDALIDIRDDNKRAGEVLLQMRTLLKKKPAKREEVEINATVSDVVKVIRRNAARRGITIVAELSPWATPILGDRVQVQQVILNLLMNACDAVEKTDGTPRCVCVRTRLQNDAMVIEVEDNGLGISDEQLQHIFQPFYTTKQDGLGLGLSICQSIVAAHGGRLDAARNANGGMSFTVTLPSRQSAAMSAATNPVTR